MLVFLVYSFWGFPDKHSTGKWWQNSTQKSSYRENVLRMRCPFSFCHTPAFFRFNSLFSVQLCCFLPLHFNQTWLNIQIVSWVIIISYVTDRNSKMKLNKDSLHGIWASFIGRWLNQLFWYELCELDWQVLTFFLYNINPHHTGLQWRQQLPNSLQFTLT